MSAVVILADVVTGESAGTAGLVALAMLLAGIIRELVARHRNGKQHYNPGPTASAVTKAEVHARDKTRERLARLHQWAEEDRGRLEAERRERAEALRLCHELAGSMARTEAATQKTLDELRAIRGELGKLNGRR